MKGAFFNPLPKTFPINLVSACERQLFQEEYTSRVLVSGTVGESELANLVLPGLCPRPQYNECIRHLPLHVVMERHDEGLVNGRMTFKPYFDLHREYIFATAYKHIVGAPEEVVEALFIPAADIACIVPAVAQPLFRFLRQLL